MVRIRRHFCQLHIPKEFHTPPFPTYWKNLKKIIRSSTAISRKHPYTRTLFPSQYLVYKEIKRHTRSKLWFSIHPYSMFWYIWRILMMFIYIFAVLLDLYKESVLEYYVREKSMVGPMHYGDFYMNIICIINIILHFFTGYVETITVEMYERVYRRFKKYTVVLEKSKIAENYFKSYFVIDIIAFEDIVVDFYAYYYEDFNTYRMVMLRMLRVVRFYTAMQTAKMIILHISDRLFVYELFVCAFAALFTLFFAACLQLYIPDILSRGDKSETFQTYVKNIYVKADRCVNSTIYFITALHKVICNFVGFPISYVTNNTFEKVLRYIIIFIGICNRAWYLSIIIPFGKTKFESWLRYRDFFSSLDPYLYSVYATDRISYELKTYFEHSLESEMFEEQRILQNVNERLKFEIFSHSSMDLIRNCHFFANFSNKIVRILASHLKYESYIAGKRVINYGDPATCMYFIAAGAVAIFTKNEFEVCHLSDGDYFGEMGLIGSNRRRTANVETIEETILYKLDSKYFHAVVKPKSKMHSTLRRQSRSRISFLRKSKY